MPRKSYGAKVFGGDIFCLISVAVLHAIPFLAEGFPWVAWLAIASALLLASRRGWTASFCGMWAWSTLAIGLAFHWSPAVMAYTIDSSYMVGLLVSVPLILWDGLRLSLGYWLAVRLTRDPEQLWFSGALCTVALEYVMPGVFAWKLGYTQLAWPWLVQAVDVFGPSFSTFVAFAFAGAILQATRWWSKSAPLTGSRARHTAPEPVGIWAWLSWSPAMVVVLVNAVYGACAMSYWRDRSAAARHIRVGLVQVDPSYVESLDNARKFTDRVANGAALICWPESSGGNYDLALNELADERKVFEMSRDPVRGLQPWPKPSCDLLLAGKNYLGSAEQPEKVFMTAMLIDRQERIVGRYNKRFLMPFGEYVPWEGTVPGLADLFDLAEHIEPGSQSNPLSSACGAKIGTMLCYEDMVPQAARSLAACGANLLACLINGSAFESRFTLYQHRLLAQSRAIECRRYFLRCAATGETCVISPVGVVESRLPLQVNDALVSSVALVDGATLYCLAPWVAPTLLAFGILSIAFGLDGRGLRRGKAHDDFAHGGLERHIQ